jgi:hypothetical protein
MLDAELSRVSPDYRDARRDRRLGRPEVHLTAPDAFLREQEARVAAGVRQTQVKDRVFTTDPDAWERLLR